LTVEIRIRSKNVDALLALADTISDTIKTPHSEPRFNQEFGDFTIYFTVAGGE